MSDNRDDQPSGAQRLFGFAPKHVPGGQQPGKEG